MLFLSPGVAESFAGHLRILNVAPGIRSRQADWGTMKAAKHPAIIGTAPLPPQARAGLTRKTNREAKMNGHGPTAAPRMDLEGG